MTRLIDQDLTTNAILSAGEGDGALDAWTLEELAEDLGPHPRFDLGSLRSAFGSDDAGG
jgi:hypothetical protein